MKRPTILAAAMVLSLIAGPLLWSNQDVAHAVRSPQITVIVADSQAVRETEGGVSLMTSFTGLLATLRSEQPIAFVSAGEEPVAFGPVSWGDLGFQRIQQEILTAYTRARPGQPDALAYAVVEAQEVLVASNAAPGSSIYLISGDYQQANFNLLDGRLSPLADKLGQRGWSITGLELPGSSEEASTFLDKVSSEAGGRRYELTVADGFKELADSMLAEAAKGSLASVGQEVLSRDDLLATNISVPPGTEETTVLLLKESAYGSLRLSNPGGLEAQAGDRTASYVYETPHLVVWRLVEPIPGDWRVDARGFDGLVSAWEYSSNKYSLVLDVAGPVPLDQPTVLMAHVQDGEDAVVLGDIRLFANLSTPQGQTLVHEMKDDGVGPDAAAGDGFFAVTIQPLSSEGQYDVELEASWAGYDFRISSEASFEGIGFPSLEVRTSQIEDLEPGVRTLVGTAYVHVQGQPYPVPTDRLQTSVASPEGEEGTVELEPRRLFGEGPAWEYEIFFTPPAAGPHSLVLQLDLEYAGRYHSHGSEPIVLVPAAPLVPEQPQVAAPAPVAAAAPVPPPLPSTVPVTIEDPQFPWMAVGIPAGVLLAIAAATAYLLTRTRPYGLIYDDREEPLVDFGQLKRHPLLNFLFGNIVRGKELNVPGLEGIVFHFSGGKVKLRSLKSTPTIRVNNQPLVGHATIQEKAWIGTGGRLYSFLASAAGPSPGPSPAMGSAGAGDGDD